MFERVFKFLSKGNAGGNLSLLRAREELAGEKRAKMLGESDRQRKLQDTRSNAPTRCNQIKQFMPFVRSSLAQSKSARPKATALHVYTMSLFLVACLLNKWQLGEQAVR